MALSALHNAWVPAVLAALAFYALVNVFDKVLRARYARSTLGLTLLFMLKSFFFLGFLPFLQDEPLQPADALLFIALGALWIAIIYPYLAALSFEEVSRVVPVWNTYPVFTLVLAALFLGERLSQAQYTAFALLLAGGLLISTRAESLQRIQVSKAFYLMLLSSIALSASVVLSKHLLLRYTLWAFFVYNNIAVFAVALLALALNYPRAAAWGTLTSLGRKGFALLLLSSLLGYTGALFYNYGLLNGPVTLVASLDGFQSIFLFLLTLFLAGFFPRMLEEDTSRGAVAWKLTAIFLMFSGLLLLYV